MTQGTGIIILMALVFIGVIVISILLRPHTKEYRYNDRKRKSQFWLFDLLESFFNALVDGVLGNGKKKD